HPEILKIIELLGEAAELPRAVPDGVAERADVDFINDRILVPADFTQHGFLLRKVAGTLRVPSADLRPWKNETKKRTAHGVCLLLSRRRPLIHLRQSPQPRFDLRRQPIRGEPPAPVAARRSRQVHPRLASQAEHVL